jgi:hypothetical protein
MERGSEITRISLHRREYLIALADLGLHGSIEKLRFNLFCKT